MKDLFYSDKISYHHSNSLPFSISDRIPQAAQHVFTAKPFFTKQRYADLEIFRQVIEESKAGLHHQPYTNYKKKTLFYQCIFFGFALLFFVLGVIALAIPSALGCGFLFSSCSFLKGILVSVCTIFSLASSTLALRLKTEKEAVIRCVRKARGQLKISYARKKLRLGVKSFFSLFGPGKQKATALRQLYHETCDKMNDKKDESLHLVHRIATAETLCAKEKEDLLNQAIEELDDQLQQLAYAFRHAAPPYFNP